MKVIRNEELEYQKFGVANDFADLADKDGVNCSKVFQNALAEYLGVKQ